jgi:hypothetical protein
MFQIQARRPLLDLAQEQLLTASNEIAPNRNASSMARQTSASANVSGKPSTYALVLALLLKTHVKARGSDCQRAAR